jgi:hypothetical protein
MRPWSRCGNGCIVARNGPGQRLELLLVVFFFNFSVCRRACVNGRKGPGAVNLAASASPPKFSLGLWKGPVSISGVERGSAGGY